MVNHGRRRVLVLLTPEVSGYIVDKPYHTLVVAQQNQSGNRTGVNDAVLTTYEPASVACEESAAPRHWTLAAA